MHSYKNIPSLWFSAELNTNRSKTTTFIVFTEVMVTGMHYQLINTYIHTVP